MGKLMASVHLSVARVPPIAARKKPSKEVKKLVQFAILTEADLYFSDFSSRLFSYCYIDVQKPVFDSCFEVGGSSPKFIESWSTDSGWEVKRWREEESATYTEWVRCLSTRFFFLCGPDNLVQQHFPIGWNCWYCRYLTNRSATPPPPLPSPSHYTFSCDKSRCRCPLPYSVLSKGFSAITLRKNLLKYK